MSSKAESSKSSDQKKRSLDDSQENAAVDKKPKVEDAKKISFGMTSKVSKPLISKSALNSFKMDLQKKANKQTIVNSSQTHKKLSGSKVAAAFGDGDESDEEEMPAEAKMRMKNIGRDTPTSAGPNSFGKSRMGFCDSKKIYEKQMREMEDKLCKEK